MFESRLCLLGNSENSEKIKKSLNGFKRRWNLGENYKPRFESKSIPNLKILKKVRIGKKSILEFSSLNKRNLLQNAFV